MNDSQPSLRLVDLFSGCGGFSLGAHQAGLRVAVAYDVDPILTSSFERNFPNTKLILDDVSGLSGDDVISAAGGRIDGIFGGPPCQGFSDIGRRAPEDPRRQLLGHFFRIVDEVQPAFFVMENVRGLLYADARDVLDQALRSVEGSYHILGPHIWDAADFGAATKRPRLFVIGIHKDHGAPMPLQLINDRKAAAATVRCAISDLENAAAVEEIEGFDTWRITRRGRPNKYAEQMRAADQRFTGHRSTAHTPDVIKRFKKVAPGTMDLIGRHPRLSWSGQCPTLRAGTGADKGSYQSVRPLHPELPRVITVREAARLQGFPDSHVFHPTVWHSFRMIGNSVSPIMAKAIFAAVHCHLVAQTEQPIAAE